MHSVTQTMQCSEMRDREESERERRVRRGRQRSVHQVGLRDLEGERSEPRKWHKRHRRDPPGCRE